MLSGPNTQYSLKAQNSLNFMDQLIDQLTQFPPYLSLVGICILMAVVSRCILNWYYTKTNRTHLLLLFILIKSVSLTGPFCFTDFFYFSSPN